MTSDVSYVTNVFVILQTLFVSDVRDVFCGLTNAVFDAKGRKAASIIPVGDESTPSIRFVEGRTARGVSELLFSVAERSCLMGWGGCEAVEAFLGFCFSFATQGDAIKTKEKEAVISPFIFPPQTQNKQIF